MTTAIPTERQEHQACADWLRRRGLSWEHVPMGGARTEMSGREAKAQGAWRGSADFRIYDRVPGRPDVRGVAIELKRVRGPGARSDQRSYLAMLEGHGWVTHVARGADDLIAFVSRLYGTTTS